MDAMLQPSECVHEHKLHGPSSPMSHYRQCIIICPVNMMAPSFKPVFSSCPVPSLCKNPIFWCSLIFATTTSSNWDCASSNAHRHYNPWYAAATTQTCATYLKGLVHWDEEDSPRCLAHWRPLHFLLQDKLLQMWWSCHWHLLKKKGYSTLVAVLSAKHTSKTAQVMAYLRTIVHVSRNESAA